MNWLRSVVIFGLLLLSTRAKAEESSEANLLSDHPVADESLPPELQDINLSNRKDGFIQLFEGYNPRGFSIYTASIGLKVGSGLEYYSGNSLYGQPGKGEPVYYKTKQNLYYAPVSELPLELSSQAAYAYSSYPIYRLGVRWKVSSTSALRSFFERLHLVYSLNFQPVQFDSIPGYNWQVEHLYQISFSKVFSLRGNVNQNGGQADTTFSMSSQLNYQVVNAISIFSEYRYAQTPPMSHYNGISFGLEYRIPF